MRHEHAEWAFNSLASFDELAANEVRIEYPVLPYYNTGDSTPLGQMLTILRGRLDKAQYGDQRGLLGQRQNLRPELDDFWREINNIEELHAAAPRTFREEGRTLPGLADERLRVMTDFLNPEPFLVEQGADFREVADRRLARGLQEISAPGLLRKARDGELRDEGERAVAEQAITFLRGEAERLHTEVVQRLSRGEGESPARRVVAFMGKGSVKAGAVVLSAVITTIIGLLVTAYVKDWLPGQSPSPQPTAPTTSRRP